MHTNFLTVLLGKKWRKEWQYCRDFTQEIFLASVLSLYGWIPEKLNSYYCTKSLLPFSWVQVGVAYSPMYNKCHNTRGWFPIVCGPEHLLPSVGCKFRLFRQGHGDMISPSLFCVSGDQFELVWLWKGTRKIISVVRFEA